MRPPLTDEPIVSRRTLLIAGGGLALAIAAWVVVDLIVVTDEERIEDFSEAITGTIDRDRVTAALVYFSPATVPITVELRGVTYHFGPDESGSFAAEARSRLAPYYGIHVGLLGRTVDVNGDNAHAVLYTMSRRGRNTIDVDLRKRNDAWYVSYLKIV